MIESFKRFRLQKKGLSCGKKRREREMGYCREFLCTSPVVMGLLLGMALNEAEGPGCFQADVPALPRSLDPGG